MYRTSAVAITIDLPTRKPALLDKARTLARVREAQARLADVIAEASETLEASSEVLERAREVERRIRYA